jgi:putative PIN family toxin of toxin-antitoxin system
LTRAVLDTNVVVAAAISPRRVPARCLLAHTEGRYELIVSPALLAEVGVVLGRERFRAFLGLDDAAQLVGALARDAVIVDDPPERERLSCDPKDDYLIALARAASAHAVVTGDRDLLDLALPDLAIVSPHEFLELLPR